MQKYRYTSRAAKELLKLDKKVRERIIAKLDFICMSDNMLNFAERLTKYEIGEYRFRIGDYRAIFDIDKDGVRILKIGHRREIYK